jgi:hypothetical protein
MTNTTVENNTVLRPTMNGLLSYNAFGSHNTPVFRGNTISDGAGSGIGFIGGGSNLLVADNAVQRQNNAMVLMANFENADGRVESNLATYW